MWFFYGSGFSQFLFMILSIILMLLTIQVILRKIREIDKMWEWEYSCTCLNLKLLLKKNHNTGRTKICMKIKLFIPFFLFFSLLTYNVDIIICKLLFTSLAINTFITLINFIPTSNSSFFPFKLKISLFLCF